ncbi:MAG: tetratricopeptide repeat protein [Desulfovibrionaceae bacterium]|nr:tetratricopeptide repeat protein [Desulfovibrionaceae bacterium]
MISLLISRLLQYLKVSRPTILSVGLVAWFCLISDLLGSTAWALSWTQHNSAYQTHLSLTLDNPYQIEYIRRPSSTEIFIPLKYPCGNINHIWVTKDQNALLKAVLLEYDSVSIKHAAFVDLAIKRTAPKELVLSFTKRQTLKNAKPDELNPVALAAYIYGPEFELTGIPEKAGNAALLLPKPRDFKTHTPWDPEDEKLRRTFNGFKQIPYSLVQERLGLKSRDASAVNYAQASALDPNLEWLDSVNIAQAGNDRTIAINPQGIRATINNAGPENWPVSEGLNTELGQSQVQPYSQSTQPNAKARTWSDLNTEPQPENSRVSDTGWRESLEQEATNNQPIPSTDGIAHGHSIPGVNPALESPQDSNQTASEPLPKKEEPKAAKPEKPTYVPQAEVKPEPKPEPKPQAQPKPEPEPEPKAEVPTPTPKAESPKPAANTVRQNVQPKVEPEKTDTTPKTDRVQGSANLEPTGLVQEPPKEEAEEEKKERPTIYVDEQGNPVEKPLDIKAMMTEVEKLIEGKEIDDALAILDKIRTAPDIDASTTEKTLYYISDCQWLRYEKDLFAGYDDIVATTNEALNFNVKSDRVPDALLRLCLINCAVSNIAEGKAYIGALLRRYPNYPGNSIGLTALGKEELKKNLNADAEKSFVTVLDKYPESSQLKDASVGLITAYVRQNNFDRAKLILEFVNKRWPRHYVDEPDFLLMQDAIENHYNQTDRRLQTLWELLNLVPEHPKAPDLFLQMADIYLNAKNPEAADFLYNRILKVAPKSPEAITAKLRLAEKGFYETPLSQEKLNVLYGRGAKPPFPDLYSDAIAASKTYKDSVLARLKLAQWYLWDKQYIEAMARAAEFVDEYPEHPDKPLADEIIWQAFQAELKNSLTEENYGRILILWNGFPKVRQRYGEPDAKLRYALAQGYRERGDEENALSLLKYFLRTPKDPTYGDIAFLDFFNKYLSTGAWNELLDLGKTVANWDLKPQLRDDLDYAMALAAQNLNLTGTALALWQKIANKPNCPLYQKAWSMVFLAQDAERKKDIHKAYDYNVKVVDLFKHLQEERSDKADPERIKTAMNSLMDICEVANRIPEALQWVNRFRNYANQNSPEYPALRFRESRLYRKLGDSNRSKALLEEIIKFYPSSPYAKAAQTELRTFDISRDLQNFQEPAEDGLPGRPRASN